MAKKPNQTQLQKTVNKINSQPIRSWVTNNYPDNVEVAEAVKKVEEEVLTDLFGKQSKFIESQAEEIETLKKENESFRDYITNHLKEDPKKVLEDGQDG